MRYNFIFTILILLVILAFAGFYIIFNVEPQIYSFLLLLIIVWLFVMILVSTILFILNLAITTFKFKIKKFTNKNADTKILNLMDKGIVKLNLSREVFRKQMGWGFVVATLIDILIIIQKLTGII